jgi:hypothetical protein
MNAKHRAKIEKEAALKKQLGVVEYARISAENKVGKIARDLAIDLVKAEREAVIHETVNVMQCAMTIALHKEFGFGSVRTNKIVAEMNTQLECVHKGLVTIEDLKGRCLEIGVEI